MGVHRRRSVAAGEQRSAGTDHSEGGLLAFRHHRHESMDAEHVVLLQKVPWSTGQ
jgi:hypothetical protein